MWEDGLGSHHEFRLYLKDNGEKHHQIHLLEIQLPGGKWIREDEWWFALLAPMLTVPCIHTLAMASQWTEDTFYCLALGQAIQSVWPVAGGRSSRVPFLSPGIKKPWLFPLALWYLCLCHVHGAQEEDGRQMEHSQLSCTTNSEERNACLCFYEMLKFSVCSVIVTIARKGPC